MLCHGDHARRYRDASTCQALSRVGYTARHRPLSISLLIWPAYTTEARARRAAATSAASAAFAAFSATAFAAFRAFASAASASAAAAAAIRCDSLSFALNYLPDDLTTFQFLLVVLVGCKYSVPFKLLSWCCFFL